MNNVCLKRWGKRRPGRENSSTYRSWHNSLLGSAGRGDLNAVKNIVKRHGGISALSDGTITYLYKASILTGRHNVVEWLVHSGADFWTIYKNKDYKIIFPDSLYWVLASPKIETTVTKLVYRENKYTFLMCWSANVEKKPISKIPLDVIRHISTWI